MTRRTKIVCTIGPASNTVETLREMMEAGMDVVRLNFSHGTHADHRQVIEHVRTVAAALGRDMPILMDLQGPKIRIGAMRGGGVLIHKGQPLILTTTPMAHGTPEQVFINYPTLPEDSTVGNRILIDDGLLELEVKEIHADHIVTEVVVGGPLRSRKGVNLPNVRRGTPSLTEKDLHDLEFGLQMDVDFIALSFVRSEADVIDLIQRVRKSGKDIKVIAKIEKPEAVADIDDIIDEADAIMVARGDLGIEIPMADVPFAQKSIIRKSRMNAKPVITATQMLDSMIDNPRPTRAEATDVANAVLDGTDAVMLSGETAVGKYPVRVIEVMDHIIRGAETGAREAWPFESIPPETEQVTEAVSYMAYHLAKQVGATAIACLTHSGATARAIAKHRPEVPLYAFTDRPGVVEQVALLWGTSGFAIPPQSDTDAGVQLVHKILCKHGLVQAGERIVITAGMPLPKMGRTNMIHVSHVGEDHGA